MTASKATFIAAVERMVTDVSPDLPTGTTPPGGVALQIRTPDFVLSEAAGVRGAPGTAGGAATMTVETHYDLASVTKIVATTAALMRLVSAGLLDLDDEVRRYVPGFSDGAKAEITVRDLLLHRAGLTEWHPLYLAADSAKEAERVVETLPLSYAPRSGRHYSDLGFMLLGRIVAATTTQSLPAAVHSLVTAPLGMARTTFARPVGEPVATSALDDRIEMTMIDTGTPYRVPYSSDQFSRWRRTPVTGQVNDGNAFHVFDGVSGHAGLFSTPDDLSTFALALANSEQHEDLWRPATVREFFAPGPDSDQALGFRRFRVVLAGEVAHFIGHTGFTGCAVGFVPERGISVVLASNRLVTPGTPVPTETLMNQAFSIADAEITERAA
ncbi:MAG: hypothetical protein JWM50_1672 [Microbacteriaceae bacterium]|jgi:CubicO group peptidase (beta-lactamase class C family)|nr:hypothetical protein [Microbacteriaceae bacterium]